MNKKTRRAGTFFSISAPSGAGKTTLVRRLLAERKDLALSISCTTRAPRAGEKEGEDYYFVEEGRFRDMVREDAFFEWEEVHGSFYGTPKAPLLRRRDAGLDTVLDIDVRGAMNLKKAYPDTCSIFIIPPSLEELEARLRRRRSEDEATLSRRLADARREMEEKDRFDHVIINDDLDRAYGELKAIMERERHAT